MLLIYLFYLFTYVIHATMTHIIQTLKTKVQVTKYVFFYNVLVHYKASIQPRQLPGLKLGIFLYY